MVKTENLTETSELIKDIENRADNIRKNLEDTLPDKPKIVFLDDNPARNAMFLLAAAENTQPLNDFLQRKGPLELKIK